MDDEPVNPSKESFFASKSMLLIAQDALHDLLYVLIGAAALIGFHKDLSTLILGMAGIRKTGTAAGVVRNTIVDGAARQTFNAAATQSNAIPTPTNVTPPQDRPF